MGNSHRLSPEQQYEGDGEGGLSSGDFVDFQGDLPTFEYQIISEINDRKIALKKVARQLQITSGDPEYRQLRDKVLKLGVVPKDLEGDATYDINEARKWYGLSEYVPSVESPDPEEAQEPGEVSVREMTWRKPRNEKNGGPDPKQQPGHIRLTNNEFNNELTLGKRDKESGRDPSTHIIPTFLRLLGIPEGDDKGGLEYKLRLAIEANDRNIPEELQNNELNPENRDIWRKKIGLEPLMDQDSAPSAEIQKLTREYFGPMPEDPYYINVVTDLKALNLFFESHQEAFPGGKYVDVRKWSEWNPIEVGTTDDDNELPWCILRGTNKAIEGTFLTQGEAEAEFNRIKEEDKQKALDLIRMARNFAIGESLDLPWETNLSESYSYSEEGVVKDSETTLGVLPEQDEIVFQDQEINNLTFNLLKFTGDDEQRLAIIRDDLEELGLSEEKIEGYILQKGIPNIPSESIRIGDEHFDWWDEHSSGYTYKDLALSQYYGFSLSGVEVISTPKGQGEAQFIEKEETVPEHNPDQELDNILNRYFSDDKLSPTEDHQDQTPPALEVAHTLEELPATQNPLQEALAGVVATVLEEAERQSEQEPAGKLARIEVTQYPGEEELESVDNIVEIERLKQEAQEAIQEYKEFGDSHAPNLRTESIQEIYRQLEKVAWDKVEELSHKLDGHLSRTLPQLRDILTAHRELSNISDVKDYLINVETIKLNSAGAITHIIDNEGNEVELNRPRNFEEIFNKPRPVRILYSIDNKNKKLGYIIEGLNLNTPDWVEGVLSNKEFLESSIIVDPWETPIEYILPNTETESSLYPIDKTPQLTPTTEASPETSTNLEEEQLPPVSVEEAIDISEYKELPEWQQTQIIRGIRDNYTHEQIALYAQSGLNFFQVEAIKGAIEKGLTVAQISEYAKPEYAYDQMVLKTEQLLNPEIESLEEPVTEAPTLEVTINPEGEQLPTNPDLGSLYYQEIQLWNNIQALKERSKQKEAKDGDIDTKIEQAKADYQRFIDTLEGSELGRNFLKFINLRIDNAFYEEQNNKYGRDKNFLEKIRDKLSREDVSDTEELNPKDQELKARDEYNQALQALLKTQEAIGVEGNIKTLFATEVQRLRDERILQSQELQERDQTGLEKTANSIKAKLFNWYIKHKNTIGKVNLALFATSTTLALTGAGLPVAGALEAVRRTIAYPMALASGVSSRELIRSKFEDGDVNILNIIKYKGGITKLVGESLQENYIQEAQDTELTAKLSTLESYYRLNGGAFTDLSQQKAYELILTELGQRVEKQTINQTNPDIAQAEDPTAITVQEDNVASQDKSNAIEKNSNYVSNLLEIVSEKRITELQRLQRNRTLANVAGTVVAGSLLANLAAHAVTPDQPSITDTPEQPSGAPQSGIETNTPPAKPPLAEGTGASTGTGESAKKTVQQLAEKAQELAEQQSQDISQLSKGETLWGEVAKQLGPNASPDQIQQGVETYMHTSQGSDTIFNLASQTEQGKALLSQLGVDNAQELSRLSTEDLYNISKYLAPGQLQGLDSLDLQSITADTIDASTIPPINVPVEEISIPTATPEQLLSKFTQAPDILDFPEGAKPLTQINNYIDRFAGDLPYDSSLGQEVLTTYLNTPEGKDWLYDAIIKNPERLSGNQNIQFVEEYFRQNGIKSGADINWTKLTQDKRFPTSMFWRETTLTGGRKLPPLSTLLKPGQMPGIKKALQLVLAKQ